ncbi:hypothetical protein B1222_12670 [Paenibacillus larvae subsp. pulvifaciens]|nr:hypothetical protein [Paenibacillus larvae]AQR79848.1 hypothetical protein BXP28_16665 [Paenibacillus larvae subsp. larvae]AQT86810.1 hypothetical protein B1222_12670 [Paenibacillus larvae subsp. pulvifaciens]MBH0341665.1 hypothetical protein [Paenibacillus larvae]MEC0185145.1 transcriptional regulator [Paenibacillus larvae]
MAVWLIPLIIVLLLIQSFCLFTNARRRGRNAWFWGLWGLIQLPCPTLFYLLFVVKPFRKKTGG